MQQPFPFSTTVTHDCPINPLVTNGLSHPYHLDGSIFILRDIRGNLTFSFHFSMKIKLANRKASDGMPRFAASHLVLFCLPMSHKKAAKLIWVKPFQVVENCDTWLSYQTFPIYRNHDLKSKIIPDFKLHIACY